MADRRGGGARDARPLWGPNPFMTVRKSSCGKVMFSQAPVILSRGLAWWGVCIGGSRGGGGTHAPPGRPNSFDFMQFSGKFGVFMPPLRVHAPPRENPGSATGVHGRGGIVQGVHGGGGAWQEHAWWGYVCVAGGGACMVGEGGMCGRRDGHCSGRYASY